MNKSFSEAVVDLLFYRKLGIASWQVHPLKLIKKYNSLYKHSLIVISYDSIMISSQNVVCHCVTGVTQFENCRVQNECNRIHSLILQ